MTFPAQAVVRYKGEAESLRVTRLKEWARADVPEPVMSNSSGPKDLTCNTVFNIFQHVPVADVVVMVRGRGPFFFLIHAAGWRDVLCKEVEVTEE